MGAEAIAIVIILIMSIVIHEMAHGYAANWLGDPTARLSGRLSANPLVHIDPLGSVILPALLLLSGSSFLFGWAKPVPYNPYNLKNQKWGEAMVAAAGPAVNILIAIIFGILIQLSGVLGLSSAFVNLAVGAITINLFLALLNMMPIPPLDGSKILSAILPFSLELKYRSFTAIIERSMPVSLILILLFFVFFLSRPIFLGVIFAGSAIAGLSVNEFLSALQTVFI